MGFVLPGETVALLAGAAAKLGHVSLAGVLVVVVVAAIVGDTVGYEVGRHARTPDPRPAGPAEAARAGSTTPATSWPAAAGARCSSAAGSRSSAPSCRPSPVRRGCPIGRFLAYNAAGGLVWGVAVVLLGYAAGASYARVEQSVGRDAAWSSCLALVVMRAGACGERSQPPPSSRETPLIRGSPAIEASHTDHPGRDRRASSAARAACRSPRREAARAA